MEEALADRIIKHLSEGARTATAAEVYISLGAERSGYSKKQIDEAIRSLVEARRLSQKTNHPVRWGLSEMELCRQVSALTETGGWLFSHHNLPRD